MQPERTSGYKITATPTIPTTEKGTTIAKRQQTNLHIAATN
jgi:hypothetical protein